MPGPLRAPIEPHRECLFQPLHNRRKLQPVCRPDIERQLLFHKSKPPKLEGEALPRLAEYPAEDRYCLPPPKQRFAIVDRRPYFIPRILR
jgi:hypothetical protein